PRSGGRSSVARRGDRSGSWSETLRRELVRERLYYRSADPPGLPDLLTFTNALSHVRTHGLAGLGDRLRPLGHGRMDRIRRRGVAARARSCARARLQFLRHRVGVRAGKERATARTGAARAARRAGLRRDEDSAEEHALARQGGVRGGRYISARSHPRVYG